MTEKTESQHTADKITKTAFHHGDLKEALLHACYLVISEQGAEHFSLADACRRAGVSTAAPYKHFRDRDEILAILIARGFEMMTEQLQARVTEAGRGTLPGIVAMGHAYIEFAVTEQHIFRLMFGRNPELKQEARALKSGTDCFTNVIEEVAIFCAAQEYTGDPKPLAVRLWTFVHGVACLQIDEDYDVVAPETDVMAMIAATTPNLLADVLQS
ncbi:MAG: TetR/AcrR family transcriptional regulator [Hyphomicrobiales bacterium]|nr:TetR/AcrR family transcriptional regulator [Hyphomicrobiales bacterium]